MLSLDPIKQFKFVQSRVLQLQSRVYATNKYLYNDNTPALDLRRQKPWLGQHLCRDVSPFALQSFLFPFVSNHAGRRPLDKLPFPLDPSVPVNPPTS